MHEWKFKHGDSCRGMKSITYFTWQSMRQRCKNSRHKDWGLYGGRGIKICQRWDSYSNFLADMGTKKPGMFIDRKNPNGNYCKRNCRWITRRESDNNKRSTVKIRHNGVVRSLTEWAKIVGLTRSTVYHRFVRLGWSARKSLTTPFTGRWGGT